MNSVQQLGTILKRMNVDMDGKHLSTDILHGLPTQYEHMRTTLDALSNDIHLITLEIVKSWLLHEEQRGELRKPASTETAFLESAPKRSTPNQFQKLFCNHCMCHRHTKVVGSSIQIWDQSESGRDQIRILKMHSL